MAASGGVRGIGWWAGALVGGLTATLGIVFNLDSLGNLLTDRAQRRSSYGELLATSRQQLAERTYDLAWAGLDKARVLREAEAWKLRGMPSLEEVQSRQADVAMAWLRNIRVAGDGATFTAIVERVQPVLQHEEVRAAGARKADVIAHLGQAEFLRARDGQGGLDPGARYREALSLDAGNPFANAMLGHWLMWNGGTVDEADKLFAAALGAQRERDYVRELQLAAFDNRHGDDTDFAFLRTLSDMLQTRETISDRARSTADAIYYFHGSAPDRLDAILHAMPPAAQLALVLALRAAEDEDYKLQRYDYYAALLEEAGGDAASARTHLKALRAHLPAGSVYKAGVDTALQRVAAR